MTGQEQDRGAHIHSTGSEGGGEEGVKKQEREKERGGRLNTYTHRH